MTRAPADPASGTCSVTTMLAVTRSRTVCGTSPCSSISTTNRRRRGPTVTTSRTGSSHVADATCSCGSSYVTAGSAGSGR